MNSKIQTFFINLPAEKRALAMVVRDVMLSADRKIQEDIKWGGLTFSYKGNFAFLYTFKQTDYMNLGFNKAVKLSDPQGLFEGTGKGMRHIKIRTKKDIPIKQVKAWVKEAMQLNEK